MKYSKEEMLKMYEHMARGRIFAIKMGEQVSAGNIRTSLHSPYGNEACGVGMISAMRDTDWFIPTHRSQNASLMRFDLYGYLCEFFMRKDGCGGGTAFDYHLSDHNVHVALPIAILGADYPCYTGFAWALKHQGKDEVVVIEAGEGACSEGATFEAWNIAALYKVPVVFVIINNEWAMSVPLHRQSVNPNISEKAVPIGLSHQIVDGNNVLAVREAMEIAVEKARNFEPNVVELKTLRILGHLIGQREYERHDKEKLDNHVANSDPVKIYEKYLVDNGVTTKTELEQIFARVESHFVETMERALKAPELEFDDVFAKRYVYANEETGADL